MEYTTLGDTGMEVSRICLGCMSFGSSGWRPWVKDEAEARPIIERAIDLGVNFFDTANMYSEGESERVLGNVLADYDRDAQVVATKGYFALDDDDPNSGGLSRKSIEHQLEDSLARLGMETVDLYQTHRWDYATPIDETLAALTDAVRRNKARYIGTSSQWAHQFADALHTADREGYERFVSMQNHYNLAYREEEREMLPLCETAGVGVVPWSPLARGYLTRPHEEVRTTERGATEERLFDHPYLEGGGRDVNERVQELAAEKDVEMAQIALAWLFHKDRVDAPIVGTTSIEHLEQAVEALDIDLTDSEMEFLEEPYEPVRVSGHE